MSAENCAICLEPFRDAVLLPACGHSFCKSCVESLPTSRLRLGSAREAQCPLCRAPYTPGSAVPNFGLRDASASVRRSASPARLDQGFAPPAAVPQQQPPARGFAGPPLAVQRPPQPDRLAALGIPQGLVRLMCEESPRVGLRLFLLDNSGSTAALDGHVLRGERLVDSSRWEEICALAKSAAALGAATGTPCEFHLLNPLRTTAGAHAEVEGQDFVSTSGGGDAAADEARLGGFLRRVQPRGVTPLAERLHALRPRFVAFAERAGATGQTAFLVIATDGAPTPTTSGTPTAAAAAAALRELRTLTAALPVRIVVRLCTDEDAAVEFWNNADAEVELPLDVLDDFTSEAAEVAKCGNGWVAYSPALHMVREFGTLVGLLDLLDERRLRPGEAATLAGLLLAGGGGDGGNGGGSGGGGGGGDGDEDQLPDWQYERAEFAAALRARARRAPAVFDGRRRRRVPQVDAEAALRAIHGASRASRLLVLLAGAAAVAAAAAMVAAWGEEEGGSSSSAGLFT